jgi:probable enterotoxin D
LIFGTADCGELFMFKFRSLFLFLTVLCLSISGLQAQEASLHGRTYRVINMRTGPGTTFEVLHAIPQGAVVDILGRSDAESNWLLARFNEQEGWIAYFTVALDGDTEALPIIPFEQNIAQAAPVIPGAQTMIPAAVPFSNEQLTAYSTTRVNVRSGPGTQYTVLGTLLPGYTVSVTGASGLRQEWLRIQFDGAEGWVASYVVTLSGQLPADFTNTLPETLPVIQPVQLSANQLVGTTRFNANLRQTPTTSAAIIVVIPYQSIVEVVGKSATGTWLQVRYQGQVGWLIGSLIDLQAASLQGVPVTE